MIYVFIKDHEGIFPIDEMCKVLEVGLSSYYRWKRSSTSKRELKKERFKRLITKAYFEFKQRYGSPRITVELQKKGYRISRITVAKYMREMGLRSKLAKKFKATTDSKHNYQVVENVLNREFEPNKPSEVGYQILLISL